VTLRIAARLFDREARETLDPPVETPTAPFYVRVE